uniref:Uncharacterized protein n=1 Tax=Paramoeba aestuarina TaxID=180227 RepID=A0A7S4NXN3_9EUKA
MVVNSAIRIANDCLFGLIAQVFFVFRGFFSFFGFTLGSDVSSPSEDDLTVFFFLLVADFSFIGCSSSALTSVLPMGTFMSNFPPVFTSFLGSLSSSRTTSVFTT